MRAPTRSELTAEIRALRARLAVIERAAAATREFAGHAPPAEASAPAPPDARLLEESERRRRTAEKLADMGLDGQYFNHETAMTVDSSGRVYIPHGHTVYRVEPERVTQEAYATLPTLPGCDCDPEEKPE